MRITRKSRQGSLLLVVLSLLILFTMVGISFVLLAGQFKRAAQTSARHETTTDSPSKQLNQAMYQLVRGTLNQRSALLGHDLLGDMYGGSIIRLSGTSMITAVTNPPPLDGQLVEMFFWSTGGFDEARLLESAGQVLTMLDGPAKGISTRIIDITPWDPAPNIPEGYRIRVERFLGDRAAIPQRGNHFIINARPFAGAGMGMMPLDNGQFETLSQFNWTLNNGSSVELPDALLPNFSAGFGGLLANAFGANESWDAPDFQNMFLAMVRYDPNFSDVLNPFGQVNPAQTIPTLHRPALINYWNNKFGLFDPSVPLADMPLPAKNLARRFIMRPMPWDHPRFSGSNPAMDPDRQSSAGIFSAMLGVAMNPDVDPATDPNGGILFNPNGIPQSSWDVDNDGDSIADSIWVDLGLPAQSTLDGRTYKPLFAFLCVDLDGRINLNAHGSLTQVASMAPILNDNGYVFAGATSPPFLPRGLGYGPADINLVDFFGANQFGVSEAAWIFNGRTDLGFPISGRYGSNDPYPGRPQTGLRIDEDPLSWIKDSDGPYLHGNPRDIRGTRWVGIDPAGRPIYDAQSLIDNDYKRSFDDPYEIRLGVSGDSPASVDQPFSLVELERVLRHNDADASLLPGRLVNLAPNSLRIASTRASITTESRDVPVPNDVISLTERFRRVIQRTGVRSGAITIDDDMPEGQRRTIRTNHSRPILNRNLHLYASPEALRGQKMDVNHRWGNGKDDNGNGVVDEPLEAMTERVWPDVADPQAAAFANSQMNLLTNGSYDPLIEPVKSPAHARQIYARHLYCMMMAMLLNGELGQENGYQFLFPTAEDLTEPQKYELTARRVAQWAINVVDFRDPDAIMSPFEYDMRPFQGDGTILGDGWDISIDGDPRTVEDGDRRIVWGCEYPELLLTETFAMHNRRVRDTKFENFNNGGLMRKPEDPDDPQNPGDPTLDQWRPPQGSLYIEFLSTRGPNDVNLPAELYTNGALHMSRTDNNNTGRFPLWRIVISEAHHQTAIDELGVVSPLAQQLAQPDSVNYDPEYRSLLKVAPPIGPAADPRPVRPLDADRIIWFSNTKPLPSNRDYGRIYYNPAANSPDPVIRNTPALLRRSEYGVLMPRLVSHIAKSKQGVRLDANWPDASGNRYTVQPRHLINYLGVSGPRSLAIDVPQNLFDSTGRKPYHIFLAVADAPQEWGITTKTIGVSITEPHPNNRLDALPQLVDEYYPEAEHTRDGVGIDESYYQEIEHRLLATPVDGFTHELVNVDGKAYDEPFERIGDDDARNPISRDRLVGTGTTENYKTAYLQRLADPLLPWNPRPLDGLGQARIDHDPAREVNPYMTVDWMPIDVTVYNGDEYSGLEGDEPPNSFWDSPELYDPDEATGQTEDKVIFASRQRGSSQANGPGGRVNIWAQDTMRPILSQRSQTVDRHFDRLLVNTLGFINTPYFRDALGVRTAPPEYLGSPIKPFPWLTWNNRPFISHLEMMLVPASAPSRMPGEITLASAFNGVNPYGPTQGTNEVRSFRAPYGHLLNFLHATPYKNDDDNLTNQRGADLCQLLDYMEVPSRFVESETWYSPNIIQAASTKALAERDLGMLGLLAPLNRVSRFRDPGKVNINTINDPRVWQALTRLPVDGSVMGDISGVSWKDLADSRRGYEEANTPTPLRHLDARFPTQFGNPFRAATSAEAMPLLLPDGPGSSGQPPEKDSRLKQSSVEATILRSNSLGAGDDRERPLLGYRGNASYNGTSRHAQFRYDGVQRLANLTTNHSNVFAVWITVGYFEVEPIDRQQLQMPPQLINRVYPDGLWLGQELGSDTGDSKRHRAFYIIDRSVPVAFEPGKNHNVDKAIMLRRFIE